MTCNQCFSQTIPLVSPQQHSCIAPTATCLLCSSACSAGKLLALEATRVTPSPCPAMIFWPQPDESSWEQEEPQPPPLPACCRGGSEGSSAQLASGESLQQLPCCHLICRERQQPKETRTQCSHRPDPSPRVWEHPWDLEPCELFTAHTSSGTHCDRQGKNFRLLRNGALWSLLLKALYNPSVKCTMKCKVLLLSQTKIIFLFLKYLGISQHFPNKSVLYKNKYWEDKRDSSPTILVNKLHFSMLKSLLSFQKISKHLRN